MPLPTVRTIAWLACDQIQWSEDIPNIGLTWLSLKRWPARILSSSLYLPFCVSFAPLSILQLFSLSSGSCEVFFFYYISALGDDTTLPPLSVKAAFFSGNHTLPLEPSSFLCVLYPVVSRDEVARESELINILAVAMKLCCNIYTHTSTTTARCLRTIHVDYNSTSLCFACCTGLKK